jgi:hypothetical protein
VRRPVAVAAAVAVAIALVLLIVALRIRPFDTPERQIDAYLAATSAGDEARALEAWSLFRGGIHPLPALLARRTDLTHELAANRVGTTRTVRSIEWWRTCCEPGPIDDPDNAGLARAHVTATDPSGTTYELVFEVFVKKLSWWGDASGETVRDWTLYEVHRASESCTFPSSAYGCGR